MELLKRYWWLFALVVVILVLGMLTGMQCSRCCDDEPTIVPEPGIDASVIDNKIDQAYADAAALTAIEIARLEAEHAADLRAFDERQREEYERVREQGPKPVAIWLTQFNRRLRADGGAR